MRSREVYYARQKYLFALVFVVVSIVPLLLLNYNASRFYQQSWIEKTSLELSTLAGDRRALIDRFLETQEDELAAFVSLYDPKTLSDGQRLAALFECDESQRRDHRPRGRSIAAAIIWPTRARSPRNWPARTTPPPSGSPRS
ncbi:MAG: hypothetical protein MZV65_17985 [Chromatiales bacterium]|nr:hypothetical protein [Chromatiales bacterium]